MLVGNVAFDQGTKLMEPEKRLSQSYYYFMADPRSCDVWARHWRHLI